MKKLTLLLTLSILGTMVSAQNNLLSFRVPMDIHMWETVPGLDDFGGTTFLVGVGSSFQHGFNDHVAAGINVDYIFSTNKYNPNLINIEPRVDYYFKSLFNGFHMGSNIGFNIMGEKVTKLDSTASVIFAAYNALQLGLKPGYSVGLGENFVFDASMGIGYNLVLNWEGDASVFTPSAFSLRPELTLGYKF